MPLKPLQQTVDNFEMFTKWLSGCCLFVTDWGPKETLSLGYFFFVVFFSFFLVSAVISEFGLGIYLMQRPRQTISHRGWWLQPAAHVQALLSQGIPRGIYDTFPRVSRLLPSTPPVPAMCVACKDSGKPPGASQSSTLSMALGSITPCTSKLVLSVVATWWFTDPQYFWQRMILILFWRVIENR